MLFRSDALSFFPLVRTKPLTMRTLFLTLAAFVIAVSLGAFLLSRLPDDLQSLPPRTGATLTSVKSWGYQLQAVKVNTIPDEVDLLVVDYSRNGSDAGALSPLDVEALRLRSNGTRRIVLCYLSIGEAENYRSYWKRAWENKPPSWLGVENPAWKGNFAVRYWDGDWQRLIVDPSRKSTLFDRLLRFVSPQSRPYLDRIIEAGFDGIYLDRVDAFEKALETNANAQNQMISFVAAISAYAKARRPGFLVVPQNGEALLTETSYRQAIDAVGKEDLFYGETGDGIANVATETRQSIGLLNRAKADGRPVFVVEYVTDPIIQRAVADELRQLGFASLFAERGLSLPPVVLRPVAAQPVSAPRTTP